MGLRPFRSQVDSLCALIRVSGRWPSRDKCRNGERCISHDPPAITNELLTGFDMLVVAFGKMDLSNDWLSATWHLPSLLFGGKTFCRGVQEG